MMKSRKQKPFEKKLLFYSLTAAAVFGGVSPLHAQLVVTDPAPSMDNQSNDTIVNFIGDKYWIDFNGDGHNDIAIVDSNYGGNSNFGVVRNPVAPLETVSFFGKQNGTGWWPYVVNQSGTNIPTKTMSSSKWGKAGGSAGSLAYAPGGYGYWHNQTDKFLGVRFQINDGVNPPTVHYGWVKLTMMVSPGGSNYAQIKAYAYETTANTGISSPLPVELTSLNAVVVDNSVRLTWNTATEVNNYGFDVERKSGNSNWTKIGFVNGSGNSNSDKQYSFTDNNVEAGGSYDYRLKQIDLNGQYQYSDVVSINVSASTEAKLYQNSPNPFNPSTAIKFYIPQTSDVTIKIYDMLGREVTTLFNKQSEAGSHITYWNGRDRYGREAASGVYLYRLTAGSFTETKKMNLLK